MGGNVPTIAGALRKKGEVEGTKMGVVVGGKVVLKPSNIFSFFTKSMT